MAERNIISKYCLNAALLLCDQHVKEAFTEHMNKKQKIKSKKLTGQEKKRNSLRINHQSYY